MSAFVALQRLLPQHLLSRAIGRAAASEAEWLCRPFIRTFANAYKVNMAEAEEPNLNAYRSFNDFFTRALKSGARPLAEHGAICPADGAISQRGTIETGQLLQAKGIRYSFRALAGPCADACYEGGSFATVYLAPSDYHRVHLPLAGKLTRTVAIPGELFSVNAKTESEIEGLFCRNERLVCEFVTPQGRMLVILVGALIVASIETVWHEQASPYQTEVLTKHDREFTRGAEIGRFLLGSTVIVCFERGMASLREDLAPGTVVRMGEAFAQLTD